MFEIFDGLGEPLSQRVGSVLKGELWLLQKPRDVLVQGALTELLRLEVDLRVRLDALGKGDEVQCVESVRQVILEPVDIANDREVRVSLEDVLQVESQPS